MNENECTLLVGTPERWKPFNRWPPSVTAGPNIRKSQLFDFLLQQETLSISSSFSGSREILNEPRSALAGIRSVHR